MILKKQLQASKKFLLSKKEKVQSYSVYLQEINNDSAIIMIIYFTRFPMALDELNELKQEINVDIKKLQEKHEIKPLAPTSVKIVG